MSSGHEAAAAHPKADSRVSSPDPAAQEAACAGDRLRQLVDGLICLALAVIVFRSFLVEGYMISTGSMAPNLLGFHKRTVCPACGFSFFVGTDDEGIDSHATGQDVGEKAATKWGNNVAACPNCGQPAIDVSRVPRAQGDQLLVHKHAYHFQPPKRWEVVVFRNPYNATQAYVKRVVGLPGEAVQIIHGDVYVDGRICRKGLRQQRAVRIPVYDYGFRPKDDPGWRPRWQPQGVSGRWRAVPGGFEHRGSDSKDGSVAWMQYRHWVRAAEKGLPPQLAPVTDVYGYNRPVDVERRHPVPDLMLSAVVAVGRGRGQFVIQMTDGTEGFSFTVDVERGELLLNAHDASNPLRRAYLNLDVIRDPLLVEMSLFDRRVLVAVNGQVVFEPWPLAPPASPEAAPTSPVRIGARGDLHLTVRSLQLYRDVFYTGADYTGADSWHAVGKPYRLDADEYFMLGDNSPVSHDSRRWPDGAVSSDLLIGKPFLVHLPSRPGKIRIGNRAVYFRIPDIPRIRYIR